MTTAPSARPSKQMAQHLATLRAYARRVLVGQAPLALDEEKDKAGRMGEFMVMANA